MRLALLAALLAANCQHPNPTGTGTPTPPDPVTDLPPDGGDASGPVTDPPTQCEVAWSVMVDAECAPATGHEVWMKKCVNYPQATIDCVMTVESCASMRNCQGFE